MNCLTRDFFPAYDRTGERLALTDWNPDDTTGLFIIDEGQPARAILNRKEVMLSPSWSTDGRKIVFGMGRFVRFTGGDKSADAEHGEDQVGIVSDRVGTLARLEVGRAYAMAGDKDKAVTVYAGFLALWNSADPDIPILKQAGIEQLNLKGRAVR